MIYSTSHQGVCQVGEDLYLKGATIFDGKKIVIGLTEDNTRTDAFWFNLFHELAHVVLGHIGKEGSVSDEDEKSADIWAADFLQSDAAS